MISPTTVSRIVCGEEALQEAVLRLASSSCWFQVTPLPDDEYEINVHRGSDYLLPACRDWSTASDEELLGFARRRLGVEIIDFADGETCTSPASIIVHRNEDGFYVTTETFISYPRNTA